MSANNSIIFSILRAPSSNKQPEVDANGYYKVALGAFNTFNSAGDFYLADGVRDLIENQSSLLHKRLVKGYLNGEMGHPQYQIGMSKESYFTRNLRIEQSNISHHIKEIMLTPTNKDSGMPGKGNVIKVEGWVKPAGPHGHLLKEALDNPDQNVAFSIRSFTEDTMIGGRNIKKLLNIVTWDWVLQPGIDLANQWDNASMESYELLRVDLNELIKTSKDLDKLGLGHEENDVKEFLTETFNIKNNNSNCNSRLLRW